MYKYTPAILVPINKKDETNRKLKKLADILFSSFKAKPDVSVSMSIFTAQ